MIRWLFDQITYLFYRYSVASVNPDGSEITYLKGYRAKRKLDKFKGEGDVSKT